MTYRKACLVKVGDIVTVQRKTKLVDGVAYWVEYKVDKVTEQPVFSWSRQGILFDLSSSENNILECHHSQIKEVLRSESKVKTPSTGVKK